MLRWHTPRFTCCVLVLVISFSALPDGSRAAETEYSLAHMKALSWVLLQLKQDYVDPTRVNPAHMLKRALQDIERRVSEVEIKLNNGVVSVQVGDKSATFKVGRPATVWEMNYNLQPIFKFI